MTPRVSVVVATRNRRRQLATALASVDSQRYRNLEVVVVDDSSDDGTVEWLRAQGPHCCIVETDRPRGAAASRNRGIARARGEIIAFLDDDDAWRPTYLEAQILQFDANPGIEMSTTGHIEIDAAGHISRPDLRPASDYANRRIHMLAECPVHTLSVVACRRSAFAQIGCFDGTLNIVHDLDWYVRLLAAGCQFAHHPEALVERGVPGGLVTRHRHWFFEERVVHRRVFAAGLVARAEERRVRAARALFFARIGFAKGDFGFGLARLAEAVAASPIEAARISAVRLSRQARRRAPEAWSTGAEARQ